VSSPHTPWSCNFHARCRNRRSIHPGNRTGKRHGGRTPRRNLAQRRRHNKSSCPEVACILVVCSAARVRYSILPIQVQRRKSPCWQAIRRGQHLAPFLSFAPIHLQGGPLSTHSHSHLDGKEIFRQEANRARDLRLQQRRAQRDMPADRVGPPVECAPGPAQRGHAGATDNHRRGCSACSSPFCLLSHGVVGSVLERHRSYCAPRAPLSCRLRHTSAFCCWAL
jgi:hypothetical protein